MLGLLESNKITVPLSVDVTDPSQNVAYVQSYLANVLKGAFPHLNELQIKVFVEGLFSFNQDLNAFKEHLRDFLVQIRVSLFIIFFFSSNSLN